MRFISIMLCILYCGIITAQDKNEIEKRVNPESIPSIAVKDLSDILGADHKVKWYYQEDGSKKVYEAKFKIKRKRYSVEFDTLGKIYNVEINADLKKFSKQNTELLSENLLALFNDYTIRKIQFEYFGKETDLFKLISDGKVGDGLSQQYEVEIIVKLNKQKKLYEIILSDKFTLISKREIRLKSTDLLDY